MEDKQHVDKTDEELVELTLGDENFFVYLIQRYEKKLLGYILKITNVDITEAEDILQEVFIKVYKNLRGFNRKLKFSSWIYRITRNEVISNYRKRKNKAHGNTYDFDNDIILTIPDNIDIEAEIEKGELQEKIKQSLSKIDIKYREVIILKYFEEKSYQEISDILKKPSGTVATLINRAKKKLAKEISNQ